MFFSGLWVSSDLGPEVSEFSAVLRPRVLLYEDLSLAKARFLICDRASKIPGQFSPATPVAAVNKK